MSYATGDNQFMGQQQQFQPQQQQFQQQQSPQFQQQQFQNPQPSFGNSARPLLEMPTEAVHESSRTLLEKLSDYFVNDGTKFFIVVFWVIACVVAFAERTRFYIVEMGPIVEILSFGIIGARAAAQVIKLNCTLLLITVLRNFLS